MRIIIFAIASLSASCMNYKNVDNISEGIYKPQSLSNKCLVDDTEKYNVDGFIEMLDDSVLRSLVFMLKDKNSDIKSASIKVERYKLNMRSTGYNDFPLFSASAHYGNSRVIKNGNGSQDSLGLSYSINYESDLSGKRAIDKNQAELNYKISLEDNKYTYLQVLEGFITAYWENARIKTELDFLENERDNFKVKVRLIESKFQNGIVNAADVYLAKQLLNNYEDKILNIKASLSESIRLLSIYLNNPNFDNIYLEKTTDTSKHLNLPKNLPLSVIECRPEIKIAEYQLESELENLKLEYTRYYPNISLSYALSLASSSFDSLLDSPARSFSTTLSLPFIEWYKIDTDIENAQLQVEEAKIKLRKTILNSLAEVYAAIESQKMAELEKTTKKNDLELSRKRLYITESRLNAGYTDMAALIDAKNDYAIAQKNFRNAEIEYYVKTLEAWIIILGDHFLAEGYH